MVGKVWWQNSEAAGPTISYQKVGERNVGAQLALSFYPFGDPSLWGGATHVSGGFPFSVKASLKNPHRKTKRFVSWVVLCLINSDSESSS